MSASFLVVAMILSLADFLPFSQSRLSNQFFNVKMASSSNQFFDLGMGVARDCLHRRCIYEFGDTWRGIEMFFYFRRCHSLLVSC